MSNSLLPNGLQHLRLPCPSPTPRGCSNSCPSSQWCHWTISCSAVSFSSSSIRVFSNESVLSIRCQSVGVSASASVLPMNIQDQFLLLLMVWSPCIQVTLKSLLQQDNSKTSILQCSAFFMVQLSHPCMTTGKTIALIRQTFVSKVMSLLFKTLSKFVIAFIPKCKGLLLSWLQLTTAVILKPKKIVFHCLHYFPVYLPWSDGTRLHDLNILNVES